MSYPDNLDISKFHTSKQNCTPPAFWPAARVRRTSVFASSENLGAGRIHFARAFSIKGGRPPWAAESPKERHDPRSCLSFGKGWLKSIFHFLNLVGFFINFVLPVFAQYAILLFLVFPSHTNPCSLHEHLIQAFLFVVDQSIHTCAHAE